MCDIIIQMKEIRMAKKKQRIKPRNTDIIAAFKREVNLSTQVVPDKSKYSRKQKHKKQERE